MFDTTSAPQYLQPDQQLDAGFEAEGSVENQAEKANLSQHIEKVQELHERYLQNAQELGFYTDDEANEMFSINILLDPAAGEGANKDRDTNLRLASIQGLMDKLSSDKSLDQDDAEQIEEQIAALVLEQAYADLVIFRKRLIARLQEEREKFAGITHPNQISPEKLAELKQFANEIDLMVFNFSNYTIAAEYMIKEFDKPEYDLGSKAIVALNDKLATELNNNKSHLPGTEDSKDHIYGSAAKRLRSKAPKILKLINTIEKRMQEKEVENPEQNMEALAAEDSPPQEEPPKEVAPEEDTTDEVAPEEGTEARENADELPDWLLEMEQDQPNPTPQH